MRPSGAENFYAPVLGKTTGGGGGEKTFSYYLYAGDYEHHPFGEVENPLGSGRQRHRPRSDRPDGLDPPRLTFDGAKERLYVDGALVDETPPRPRRRPPANWRSVPRPNTATTSTAASTRSGSTTGRSAPAEVAADMEAPIETPKSGPVAEYSFDEGSEETGRQTSPAAATPRRSKAPPGAGPLRRGLPFDGEETASGPRRRRTAADRRIHPRGLGAPRRLL